MRVVLKFISFLAIIMIFLISTIAGLLHLNRETIYQRLINYFTQETNGELAYSQLSLNPFAQFPGISITLKDVSFALDTDSIRRAPAEEILQLEKLHLAFDILELMKGNVDVKKVRLENGLINLVQYEDSSFNVQRVLDRKAPDTISVVDEDDAVGPSISIALDDLLLRDIALLIDRKPIGQQQRITLSKAKLSFNYLSDSIQCSLDTDLLLNDGFKLGAVRLAEEPLKLDTDFIFDVAKKQLHVHTGDLGFRNARLQLSGMIDFADKKVDISFASSDEDLGLARLLLTSQGFDHIRKGNLFLNGTIQGNYNGSRPRIDVSFGANDFTVKIPKTDKSIEDLNLLGRFASGNLADLSLASLWIDTLHATMPDGHLRASIDYQNFVSPTLTYSLDLKTSIDNLDQVFALGSIKSLRGSLALKDQFRGKKLENEWIDRTGNANLSLELDSISLSIPDIAEVDLIDGTLGGSIDSITIEELKILTDYTDLQINGEVKHIRDLFFDLGHDVEADLEIASANFDFPSFWSFKPKLSRSFPYVINDLLIEVTFATNYRRLTEHRSVPDLTFEVHHLNATVPKLLPSFTLSNGTFDLRDGFEGSDHFHFKDFTLEIGESRSQIDFELFDFDTPMDSMRVDLAFTNIDPKQLAFREPSDSNVAGGLIDGKLCIRTKQSTEKEYQFDRITLEAKSLRYVSDTDTLELASLSADANSIQFKPSENPLASLSTQLNLDLVDLRSKWLNKPNLSYEVSVEEGVYKVTPVESSIFGKIGKGTYTLSPFADPLKLQFDYVVNQYAVEDFISGFYEEPMVSGLANLELHLTTFGQEKEALFKNLEGSIDLNGENLTVYGLDMDRIIRKFERTQKFNLLDFSSLVLAGPVGIAISKGSNYLNLLRLKAEDSTLVNELSSKWEIKGGRCTIVDVAFATYENRIAGQGWVDFESDSLDIQVAALDRDSCPIISQRMGGSRLNPKMDGIKVIPTIMAPLTSLFSAISGKDCDVFYTGRINHPQKKRKNE